MSRVIDVPAGALIARELSPTDVVHVLVSGWTCGFKALPGGRRRICSLGVSGDAVDLEAFVSGRLDHSIVTLTPCRLGVINNAYLSAVCDARPGVVRFLWGTCTRAAAIQGRWLLGDGRQSAAQRLAHRLCELSTRLQMVGEGDGLAFHLPLNQTALGEAIGVSLVHANRVVGELRARGLVRWRNADVIIADWRGLSELAEFEPSYLDPLLDS